MKLEYRIGWGLPLTVGVNRPVKERREKAEKKEKTESKLVTVDVPNAELVQGRV